MAYRKPTALIQTLLTLVGALDAGTIYVAHRAGADLPCTTGGGCDLVNASHWSAIDGVPVALIGAFGYIVMLFTAILRLTTDSQASARRANIVLLAISFLGTCYSWYLQYVAAVFIGAFCIWCRVSAITMTLIFLTSLTAWVLAARSGTGPAPGAPLTEEPVSRIGS